MAAVLLILKRDSRDWEYFRKGALRALGARLWVSQVGCCFFWDGGSGSGGVSRGGSVVH